MAKATHRVATFHIGKSDTAHNGYAFVRDNIKVSRLHGSSGAPELSIPRLSINSLANQLHAEPKTLCVIVEGFTDRCLLTNWSQSARAPVIFYSADEIESEITPQYAPYGGNKARVATVISSEELASYADRNAIGFIDRDIDFINGREIQQLGLYYTEYACLVSQVITKKAISNMLQKTFLRIKEDDFIQEVFKTSERIFRIRAEHQRLNPRAHLPGRNKYIRRIKDGGFDWDSYLKACNPVFLGRISEKELRSNIFKETNLDNRIYIHLHSTVELIHILGKKEGIFDNTVSEDEIHRHIISMYSSVQHGCKTVKTIEEKILTLPK